MDPREPAGWERGKGKSAELSAWAQAASGAVGNTRGTVCGMGRRCAIRLQSLTPSGVHVLSVGACLYRLFILVRQKSGQTLEG